MVASDPGQARGRRGWMLDGLLFAALLALALRRVLPSFQGWYHEDDLHNLRWVMEYRDTPWVALTERHSLHDHVRPLTLMTLWLGGFLSNGAYWGQHVLLVGLALLGWGGLGVLASELSGQRRVGLLAMALGLAVPGFGRMVDWNAWMCSAGEIAAGLWGLVFARRALSEGRWWTWAALCLVAAGLYKEPGWVVYPVGALALAWGARAVGRRAAAVAALAGIGVVGFWWSWNPTNLSRMSGVGLPWPLRALRALGSDPLGLLDGWPAWDGAPGLLGPGLGVPLVAAALAGMVLARRTWLWLGVTAVVTAISLAFSGAASGLLIGGCLAVLVARIEDPPLGLVLSLLTLGVMAPFNKTNEVQILLGGYGLALAIAVETPAILAAGAVPRAVFALLLAGQGLRLGAEQAKPIPTSTYAAEFAAGERLEATGALARTLRATDAWVLGAGPPELEILPMVGLMVRGGTPPADAVAIGDTLAIRPDPQLLQKALLLENLLRNRSLPRVAPGEGGLEISVIPGWYALGLLGDDQPGPVLQALDACGNRFQVGPSAALPTRLSPLALEPGCEPLRLGWVGSPPSPQLRPLLAPLEAPRLSLWGPDPVERVLRVGPELPRPDAPRPPAP